MSIGFWQLVLVLVIVFVIFGAGKLPKVMGELGAAMRALRSSMADSPKTSHHKNKAKKKKPFTTKPK